MMDGGSLVGVGLISGGITAIANTAIIFWKVGQWKGRQNTEITNLAKLINGIEKRNSEAHSNIVARIERIEDRLMNKSGRK